MPGPALSVFEFRMSVSPLTPFISTMVASPIGLMLSVRTILSGSCTSIVNSPVTWRSPISRASVPVALSP